MLLLVIIGMASCSGDDTGIEVIPEQEIVEPETVEEVVPEPEPEPVVETVYVPTLESLADIDFDRFDFLKSWADIDVANGEQIACNDRVFTEMGLSDLQVTDWDTPNPITTEWKVIGGPTCERGEFYPIDTTADGGNIKIDLVMPYPYNSEGNLRTHVGPESFFFVKNRVAGQRTRTVGEDTITERAVGGDVYGRFDPESQEAKGRKQLARACGRSYDSDPDGDFFQGEWQAVSTVTKNTETANTVLELCVKLDDMPGAVKCVVSEYEGGKSIFEDDAVSNTVVLYIGEDDPVIVVEDDEFNTGDSPLKYSLFNNGDYVNRDKLCNLFDGVHAF